MQGWRKAVGTLLLWGNAWTGGTGTLHLPRVANVAVPPDYEIPKGSERRLAKLSVRCAWFLGWALAPAGVEKRVEEPE